MPVEAGGLSSSGQKAKLRFNTPVLLPHTITTSSSRRPEQERHKKMSQAPEYDVRAS